MKQIRQADKRVLLTDEWLYVKGCEDMYAIRDCASSWNQRAKIKSKLTRK
ncbi:hypothetical protein PRUPE_3G132100 [Prunus persica]|uniref:Uncharacterized protein n=1 Tax=Prunus persica TaxID=3760 RepID=A0A251PZH9_PRUPE|nr:hypothetical protein PRUPE_3G132100 [Prunus persica]ONI16970.1 hypothetical protein PRUPE_3G132100 [Prunus persica]ONI16971.1 hypothetical protein PRUPE_3G132100 [Prunus persica]